MSPSEVHGLVRLPWGASALRWRRLVLLPEPVGRWTEATWSVRRSSGRTQSTEEALFTSHTKFHVLQMKPSEVSLSKPNY